MKNNKKHVLVSLIMVIFTITTMINNKDRVYAAIPEIELLNINSPNEATTRAEAMENVVYEGNTMKNVSFEINEDGWALFHTTNYCKLNIYSSSDMNSIYASDINGNKRYQSISAIEGYHYWDADILKFYLPKGKYYMNISSIIDDTEKYHTLNAFFLPTSKVINQDIIEEKTGCSSANLSLIYNISGTSQIYNGDIPYYSDQIAGINNYTYWNKAETSATDIFTVNTNGIYTIKIIPEDDEWSDYPVMIKYTVDDITGHKLHKVIKSKANTTKNGLISYTCDECGQTVKTKTIAKPKVIKLSKTSYKYSGKVKKPSVKVLDDYNKVIPKSEYSIRYSNNKKVGKAKVLVKFKGTMYSGKLTKYFSIVK